MSDDFKIWWHNEGSGMPSFKDEETCDHVERVSAIAWSNGAFKATLSLEAENARLKAEVEAQAKRWAESEDLISHYKQQMDEVINDCQCSSLKAEVERLTKAGNELERVLISRSGCYETGNASHEWQSAKNYKPSV